MNQYNFTDRVRKILAMAREESARLRHEYVGTEHMLLAMIAEGDGVGAAVLQNFNVPLNDLRDGIEGILKPGTASASNFDLPYTSRAKKVLELAMDEGSLLQHNYVGSEHLLLGLLREEKGIAAQMLAHAGLQLDRVRAEVVRLLGTRAPTRSSGSSPAAIASVAIAIFRNNGSVERRSFASAADAISALNQMH